MSWLAQNWLSAVSVTFGVVMALIAIAKDLKGSGAAIAIMNTKLDSIGADVVEVKGEIKNINTDAKDYTQRLVACEESVKSAHKRIDEITKKGA